MLIYFFFFLKTEDGLLFFFFFQAEDGIRDTSVTGVQTCALPISNVEPVGLPGQGREVDDAVDHGRGARDLAARVEAPADVPGHGVERVEVAVVGADEDVPP